jgi:hypothetical protein
VSELVGVDGPDPGVDADASDDAVHGPPVDRDVAVSEEPSLRPDVIGVGGGPAGEEGEEVGVQGDEAVVAELPDWGCPVSVDTGFRWFRLRGRQRRPRQACGP